MTVRLTFHIPSYLRAFTQGRSQIDMTAAARTVRDALDALWRECPGVRDRVLTESGNVREHVNVFVGPENIRWLGGLDTPVGDGEEITIVPAVSGGR